MSSGRCSASSSARARSPRASSRPTASNGSGATPRCCASSGAVRWPRCASEIEPVDGSALVRFLPRWQGIGSTRRGPSTRSPRPWACCRGLRCPRRCSRPTCSDRASASTGPADLDALCSSGEMVWVGAGALGANDGRVRLVWRDQAALLVPGAGRTGRVRHRRRPPSTSCAAHLDARGRVVLDRPGGGGGGGRPALRRRDRAGRAVGPGVGGRGHQRLAGCAAGQGGGRDVTSCLGRTVPTAGSERAAG